MTLDFSCGTRVVHGFGVVDRVGELVRPFGERVLLVTDPGIVAAGHVERVGAHLREAGLAVEVFDAVHENPTTDDVAACVEQAKEAQPDVLVALGGGSSMDCAKGCNFILTNGGRMQDYWGHDKATKPMLPFIAVPTTAGTGSEMQSYALISDAQTHQKMACGDRKTLARVAILDATLTVSQPRSVIACAGLDTIVHAVETAVTTKRNAFSTTFARESFRLGSIAFPRVLAAADDLDAQSDMMLAAAFAGLAIENSMLGAAHSMANPLTAEFGVVHGHAVGMMLPGVVHFNAHEPGAKHEYETLAAAARLGNGTPSAVETLVQCIRGLYAATGLAPTLAECGVPSDAVPMLAEGAARQWTAQFNPRPIGQDDFETLYSEAMTNPA